MTRAAFALVVAAMLASAPSGRAEVHVDVRVTEEPAHTALVEVSADEGTWVALYGAFSDGSLRTIFPSQDSSSAWLEPDEVRVISVDLGQGLHLESVQAVASPRWFDPRRLWIASGLSRRPAGGSRWA